MSRVEELSARVRERFPEALADVREDLDGPVLVVRREHVVAVCTYLRDQEDYRLLSDLCGVDRLGAEPRFEVNLNLTCLDPHERVRVKVQLDADDPSMPSLTDVWRTANFHEREVYDFFGITFDRHPNLTRLFMPDEWIGHPLRKDYSVGGVPVEYKIEPAYVGDRVVSEQGRPAAGGVPGRLMSDRGTRSPWTWSGPPASGVRVDPPRRKQEPEDQA